MRGITTTPHGITSGQVVPAIGKPEAQARADAADRLLRGAGARLADNGAPVRAV